MKAPNAQYDKAVLLGAWKDNCQCDQNWSFGWMVCFWMSEYPKGKLGIAAEWIGRTFHTLKFCICYLLSLERKQDHWGSDYVFVGATIGSFRRYSGYPDLMGDNASWESLNVGAGLFRNWWYVKDWDSWA